ncbi:MAG TPA: hypothetical protein VIF12_04685 [Micavibrio sp.]
MLKDIFSRENGTNVVSTLSFAFITAAAVYNDNAKLAVLSAATTAFVGGYAALKMHLKPEKNTP